MSKKEVNQREAAFCVYFTTIGSETFGDGTQSATAAGYSEKSAHVAASRLLKRDKVRKRILELHTKNMQENMITVEKVLADLEHDKIMARKVGQYAVAKGCTELQGKYLAMFTENVNQTGAGLNIIVDGKEVGQGHGSTLEEQESPEKRREELAKKNTA